MPGYDRTRIIGVSEDDLQEFICSFCHSVFIKPTFTECCGQTYCYECITEWVSQNAACPYGCQQLSKDQLKSSPKIVINLLNKMRIKCEFEGNGCESVVRIGNVDLHQGKCLFNPDLKCEKCDQVKIKHSDKLCSNIAFEKFKKLSLYTNAIESKNDKLRAKYFDIEQKSWDLIYSPYDPNSPELKKAKDSILSLISGSSSQTNLTNEELIDELLDRELMSVRVAQAMKAIDRANYCLKNPYSDSGEDDVFGISGVNISAPLVHAKILEYVKHMLTYSAKVLDVGSGTGYLTACMAYMAGINPFGLKVGKPGKVIGIEKVTDAVDHAKNNVWKDLPHYIPRERRIDFHVGDGREGFAQEAPYDLIHVGALCETIPQKPGGVLIIPIEIEKYLSDPGVWILDQEIKHVEKMADGSIESHIIKSLDFSYSSKLE